MAPETQSLSSYVPGRPGDHHAGTRPRQLFATQLRALQHLRVDQLVVLLTLLVGALVVSLAPPTLVLTVGFLLVTFGILGLVPLAVSQALTDR